MLQQAIVYFIIAVFIGVSQSAGIGGGPILNVSLMIGLGYEAKDSMSVTYIFLMGGAFASMWVNYQKKNPKTGGPIMDYNLIMVTLPMAVSGSLYGTIMNHFISELIVTILFTILLGYLSRDSYKKYQAVNNSVDISSIEKRQPFLQMHELNQQKTVDPRLQQILNSQRDVLPKDKVKIIAQIFLYTVIILLCKGGTNYDSILGFQSCGFGSWICIIGHLTLSYLYSKSIAMKQFEVDLEKQRLGFVYQNESQKMSQGKMRSTMMYGFFAGLMGGMLGLGGAIILVPVWLNAGIDKNIATSSSAPLIFFSALVAYFLGFLSGAYDSFTIQIFYFVLAYIGSYGVKKFVTYIAEKYNLKAIIFLLLLITMISSLAALLPFQIAHALRQPDQFFQFGKLC